MGNQNISDEQLDPHLQVTLIPKSTVGNPDQTPSDFEIAGVPDLSEEPIIVVAKQASDYALPCLCVLQQSRVGHTTVLWKTKIDSFWLDDLLPFSSCFVFFTEKEIEIGFGRHIYSFDRDTGEKHWKITDDDILQGIVKIESEDEECDQIIVNSTARITKYDRMRPVWESDLNGGSGFLHPVTSMVLYSKDLLLAFNNESLFGINPANGKVHWQQKVAEWRYMGAAAVKSAMVASPDSNLVHIFFRGELITVRLNFLTQIDDTANLNKNTNGNLASTAASIFSLLSGDDGKPMVSVIKRTMLDTKIMSSFHPKLLLIDAVIGETKEVLVFTENLIFVIDEKTHHVVWKTRANREERQFSSTNNSPTRSPASELVNNNPNNLLSLPAMVLYDVLITQEKIYFTFLGSLYSLDRCSFILTHIISLKRKKIVQKKKNVRRR
jgi:outer membrane protein assembly factor BamB